MVYNLIEKVNKGTLKYILDHHDEFDLGNLFINGRVKKEGVLNLYNKYYNSLNEVGEIKVSYKQNKNKIGRHYPHGICLTTMSKRVRHSIGRMYHIDLDIENCHPVLLSQICSKHKINCSALDNYIQNRHLYTEEKDRVYVIINGGVLLPTDSPLLFDISHGMNDIYSALKNIYPKFYKMSEEKDTYNVNGRMMSYILQNEENTCLEVMIKTLKTIYNITPTSLAYDGFTLEKTKTNHDMVKYIISDLENMVNHELGYTLKLREKPMDKGFSVMTENKSPLKLLKPIPICNCIILHDHMETLLHFIISSHNITSFDYTFNEVCPSLISIVSGTCLEKYMDILTSNIFDVDEKELNEYISRVDKVDKYDAIKHLMTFIDRKNMKILYQHFLRMLNENRVVLKNSVDTDFSTDSDIYDFVNHLRTTTFPSQQKLKEYFLANVSKYVKFIQFPECFIVNMEKDNEVQYSIEHKIFGTCSYTEIIEDTPCVFYKSIFDTPISLWADLEVKNKVKLFRNITFNPIETNDKEFNMYRGFRAQDVENVDINLIQPILNHIKMCWANDDDDIYDYIIHWFNHCFTKPWMKSGIVLLLCGLEGTGKGLLIDNLIIPYIYGDTIACVSQGLSPIVQRFNSICMNKLFICCNEVSTEGGFHTSFEKLKAIITDKTISIEKKGIDIFKDYPNFINFIFTTNNTDSVKLGRTDRRYCCLETSSRYKGQWDYFTTLLDNCNQDTANHFYTFCKQYPITRNIRNIPRTKLKDDMMMNAKSTIERFVEDIQEAINTRNKNELIPRDESEFLWDTYIFSATNKDGEILIKGRDIYKSYSLWCRENNETRKSNTLFGRELKKLVESVRTKTSMMYKF